MVVLKMYELGKNFVGKVGELVGLFFFYFFEFCGMYGVSIFNYSFEEIEDKFQ